MAPKKKFKKKMIKRIRPIKTVCLFCESKTDPDYKEYRTLEKFLSDRAKIYGRDRSGLCNHHQHMLPVHVKRARHLGLLPYSISM